MATLPQMLRQLQALEAQASVIDIKAKKLRQRIKDTVGLGFEMPAKLGRGDFRLAKYATVSVERWDAALLDKHASPELRRKARVTGEVNRLTIVEIDEEMYQEYV